jgi:hypothetical protein
MIETTFTTTRVYKREKEKMTKACRAGAGALKSHVPVETPFGKGTVEAASAGINAGIMLYVKG